MGRTKNLVILITVILVFSLVPGALFAGGQGESGQDAEEETITIRFAGNMPATHHNSLAMEVFAEEVEKQSNGRVEVDTYPAMQLGGAGENVDMVKSGTLFMCYVGAAYVTGYVPEIGVTGLPFLFKSREKVQEILVNGQLGQELLSGPMSDAGLKGLGFWDLGSRNITNNVRPIEEPEDLKGIKIRLQPADVMLATFRALGANPVAMDIKEVYTAMKQGVIDAHENPFSFIKQHRFYEVQDYLSVTGHFYDTMVVFANQERYEALPDDIKEIIGNAMVKATKYDWEKAGVEDQEAFEFLKENMQVNELDGDQINQFREATSIVYEQQQEKIGKEWIDKFLEANK